jgi:pimeloyl-ACP methyl ester carboxylesterase
MGSSAAIRARTIETDRLRMHTLEAGPDDGEPVVLIHGNLSSGRFFDNLMAAAPERYHLVAPDMRSFGRSEPVPIDATRGVRDWADDTAALVAALGIDRPVHLAGWSTGGAAAAMYAIDRPVASLTLIDPVSPFGFGGTRPDGSPYFADHCGSGGGTGNPEFTALLAKGDRSTDSMFSPRNILNASYWSFSHKEPPEHEDLLLDEVLLSVTGDDGYPGDLTPSEHWPGFAPGTRGILNALSSKYCNW